MPDYITNILIFVSIFAAQFFLSRTKYKFLALIVPVFAVIYAIYYYQYANMPLWAVLFLLVLFLILLFSEYKNGQKNYNEKVNKELERMKSKDM